MDKPDLPYVVDYEFSVVEHHPPQPHETENLPITPDEVSKRQYEDVITLCISRNPIAG